MANYSESAGAMPADEARPNWSWLQARLSETARERLEHWITDELAQLEQDYDELVTRNSRNRSLRGEISRQRDRQ